MTLVELMTVVAILGVLMVILGFSFQGWLAKYKVEEETKRFYTDLSDARARAMQKKRVTFVDLAAKQYRTFEDTNTAPDGNGTLETAADTRVANVSTNYIITPTLTGGVTQFAFDREGLASATGPEARNRTRGRFSEDSYAVLGREYMVVSLRMGYHFTTVEALSSPEPSKPETIAPR